MGRAVPWVKLPFGGASGASLTKGSRGSCHGWPSRHITLGMIDYMQKGGPLMWLILLCSVLAGAVFLERVTYFHRAQVRVGEFLRGLANLLQRRSFTEALGECAATPGPVARVIHAAILRHDAPRTELKEIVQEAGQLEVPRLERRLGILVTIAFVAPLLGLLGTVT